MNHPTVTEIEAEILRRLRRIDWLEAESARLREALMKIATMKLCPMSDCRAVECARNLVAEERMGRGRAVRLRLPRGTGATVCNPSDRGRTEVNTKFKHPECAMNLPIWKRCLLPHSAADVTNVCDEPLDEWADTSWRCKHGHYNPRSTLVREALGRLVREVWVVWAHDRDGGKPHHLLPWEQLSADDREVDRRIGETLLGIRDWRNGQTTRAREAFAALPFRVEHSFQKEEP